MKKKHDTRAFCRYPQAVTDFSPIEELTLSQEMGLRKLVQRLTKLFRIPTFSEKDLDLALPSICSGLEYYSTSSWELVPELFFKQPEAIPLVCVSTPVCLSDGEVRDITFKTKFKSSHPNFIFPQCANGDARSVRARHWVHANRPSKGCVIAIHGWMLGDQKASALTMVPGYFYRLGLDVLVVELPLHGGREPLEYSPSVMFPSIDPSSTNEQFAQSIFELRELSMWLRSEYSVPIIPVGLSLGAQVASLWASLDKLDASIIAAPLVSLSNFIWSQVRNTPLAETLVRAGLTEEVLERAFAPSCPLSYQLQTPKDKILFLAGKRDSIVPVEQAQRLWEHWDKPEIHWIEEGHVEQLLDEGCARKVKDFLFLRGLANKNFLAVSKS